MLRIHRLLLLSLLLFSKSCHAQKALERKIRVLNEAGFKVLIYWINRWNNDDLVLNSEEGIFHGSESTINSFLGHEFEVHEVPHKRTNACRGPDNSCRKAYFQVNSNEDQTILLKENLTEVVHSDNVSKAKDQAKDVLKECKAAAMEKVATTDNKESALQDLMECIQTSVEESTDSTTEEIQFQERIRKDMGSKLVQYACRDDKMNTTNPTENVTWTFTNYNKQFEVKRMLDRPMARIDYVYDFATENECGTVQMAVEEMHRVDDGLHAKTGKVGIPFNFAINPISTLANKMYSYTRDNMQVALTSENAEPIHYVEYQEGDYQEAHSNDAGDSGRMATFQVYCDVAKKGGAVHFHHSGIHIKPKPRSAIFMSYIDSKNIESRDTTGFTHSTECTVMEGTKRVVQHSIRMEQNKA